ncbi:MAG: hypothetical protein ACOCXH_00395 [Cyclobacteriaceae bacterium]
MIKPCVPSQVAYGHGISGNLFVRSCPYNNILQRFPVRETCCAIAGAREVALTGMVNKGELLINVGCENSLQYL